MKTSIFSITLFTLLLSGCNSTLLTNAESNSEHLLTNNKLTDKNTIIKSPNDPREYRYLELDNGLKVVLVSDSNTDKSAVSLNVHVGHMDDPKDREGLSHFLEHMLFLGSTKYPKADEYNEFIKSNGGITNAITSQQNTTYFFQVNERALKEATDRFAQFFISPSFNKHYVEREKNAVNAEYKLKIKDETRRIREVLKDTSNPSHPFSQFSVGNLNTLADRDKDLLIDAVKAHYAHYYSANRMSLAIIGHEGLDTLERWVREKFSTIPNNGFKTLPNTVNPYLDEQLAVKINIEPLSSKKQLILSFPVPKSIHYFHEKPLIIIASLIGDESNSSLYHLLKKKGLITSLKAGYNASGPDDFELFNITFGLTSKGEKYYQKVTESVFSYLKLLTNEQYNQQYFTEKSLIAKTKFDFQKKLSPQKSAFFLSSRLQYFLPQNLFTSAHLYGDYSHKLHMDYLSYFTPQNMRLILIGKGVKTNLVQPEYNTPYAIEKLTAKELARYQSPSVIRKLTLPIANNFISTDTHLKNIEQIEKHPLIAFKKPGFTFWYKQNTEFRAPKLTLTVQIYSQHAGRYDALSHAKKLLYIALLKESLNEIAYPAKKAGLNYKINDSYTGMKISVSGYNEKVPVLLSLINQKMRQLSIEIDNKQFIRYKNNIKNRSKKIKLIRPVLQAADVLLNIQLTNHYSAKEVSDAITGISVDDLIQYIKSFHQDIEVDALAYGNISTSESIILAKNLYTFYMTDTNAQKRTPKTFKFNNTQHALIKDIEIDHNDSIFNAQYFSPNNSATSRAKYYLLGNMIRMPFFTSLRTEQQVGYSVRANSLTYRSFPGLSFWIQSPVVNPIDLTRRVDKFLNDYQIILKEMSHDKFVQYKQGLIQEEQAKHQNLTERSQYYWSEIYQQEYEFDSKSKKIEALKKLTKSDMEAFYSELLKTVHPIIVISFGKAHQSGDDYKNALLDKSICHKEECFKDQLKELIKN